jgi:hypothetical protein
MHEGRLGKLSNWIPIPDNKILNLVLTFIFIGRRPGFGFMASIWTMGRSPDPGSKL